MLIIMGLLNIRKYKDIIYNYVYFDNIFDSEIELFIL